MLTKLMAIALAALLLLSGFAVAEGDTPIRITASFYPLYIAAINITKDVPGIEVQSMAPPSAGCLHDYQLTTADRVTLENSNILILNGAGLETFLDKLLPQLGGTVIDASTGIDLLQGHHNVNAHIWVSIPGMMAQVANIAEGLATADPAHADLYHQNAAEYAARLETLYSNMQEILAPFAGAPIVTFHEAFDYFARDSDLRVVATIQNHENSMPSPRELADVAETIKKENVKALFAEPQYDDASVDILARETGLPVYLLDPAVSGELDPTDYDAYIRIMEQNTQVLVEALS